MMTKVEARNLAGTLLTLLLDDVTNGYIVEDIDGLDPVKATLVSSSYAKKDGVQYQSARREARYINLKIGIEPSDYEFQNVRGLRNALYGWFMPKSKVNLRFYDTSLLVVDINGVVESFESKLFAKEPYVNITVMCEDPDFIEVEPDNPVELSGNTVADSTEFFIQYKGTVDTGFVFELNLNRSLTDFTIYHRPPDGSSRALDFSASLISGDVLTISTVSGDKYVTLTRSGVTSSLLYGRSPESDWITLQPGFNYLRVYATGSPIPFDITYINRYGGL